MTLKHIALAALAAVTLATSALAGEIDVRDAYARASSPAAKAGAIFMTLANTGTQDDRLLAVASDVAQKVELHTHVQSGDGIMKMTAMPDGIDLPAGATHALERGGDHVMLMGLTRSLAQDDTVTLKLTFEHAGEITVDVPVDLTR